MKTDQVKMSLLLDEYGALLTEKQRTCCELYYNEDFSLSEIADELGISRQGVHDNISRAETTLRELEQALGNVKKTQRIRAAAAELRQCAAALQHTPETAELVRRVLAAVGKLEE